MVTIQQGLREDGIRVLMARLCAGSSNRGVPCTTGRSRRRSSRSHRSAIGPWLGWQLSRSGNATTAAAAL